jgi:hypothetical protein
MKKIKRGGKSHKRMMDGGMASIGTGINQRPGMYRPVGRPGRGGPMGGGAFSDIQGGGGGGLSKIVDGGAMGRPIRGGGMTSDIGSVPMGRGGGASGLQQEIVGGMGRPLERPGMKGSPAAIMGRPGRGGAMTSDANSVPMGRGGAMPSAISQGIGSSAQPMGRGGAMFSALPGVTDQGGELAGARGFRKGGVVKRKKMAAGGIAYSQSKPSTISNRPAKGGDRGGAMYRPIGGAPSAAGRPSTVKPSSPRGMRGGGLARKGVGMALAKGGLAKRAGGAAKRGVGRGKMV